MYLGHFSLMALFSFGISVLAQSVYDAIGGVLMVV